MATPHRSSVLELLRQGTEDAHLELRRRGVLRSAARNPTGDYAEWIVARQLGADRAVQSQIGYDLLQPDGVRVQVKGRRMSGGSLPQKFGTLYELDAREFDFIAAVLLDVDWTVREAWWVPWEAVPRVARWSVRRHHWRLSVSGRWKSDGAVSPLDLRLGESDALSHALSPLNHRAERSLASRPQSAIPSLSAVTGAVAPLKCKTSGSNPETIRALVASYADGKRTVGAELRRLACSRVDPPGQPASTHIISSPGT